MFIEPTADELDDFEPEALVLHAPEVEADPAADGTRTGTFVVLHPARTRGADRRHVLRRRDQEVDLHGDERPAAARGRLPDALLGERRRRRATSRSSSASPGTGKTTLSADPERSLIGDDEHGWGDSGVFNFEGGCYAKVIRLSAEAEPEIYKTTHTFGTILENVAIDEQRRARPRRRLEDREHARRVQARADRATRCPRSSAGHPSAVVMLTADAFGILPPIARLTRDQALFYFLSGFTAKLAGTEIGVTEPQPTFSTCFGAPFLPQPPAVYARMLGEKLDEHGRDGLARQHGLDGRPVRRGPPDADRGDARRCCAPRSTASSTTSSTAPTRSSASRCRSSVPGVDAGAARPALDVARPGRVRPQGARARADVPRQLREVRRTSAGRRRRTAAERLCDLDSVPMLVDAKHDVLVVGAGCAGMRAAIEAFDAGADVALISKIHPTRSHSGAAEGGINAALGNASEDDPETHAFDTVKGSDYLGDQDAIEVLCDEAPGRRLPARELGRRLLAHRGRPDRAAPVRRRRRAAHRLRGRHHRPRPDPGALRADDEARHPRLRGVLRLEARRRRRPLPGRDLLGPAQRRPEDDRREDGDPRHGRRGPALRRHDERLLVHRRRDGDGAARRRPAEGHGDDAVPPDDARADRAC